MPSLKEIKGRIGSVQSTLKITSSMKLVASAKLKRAQTAIGNMLPYQKKLNGILLHLLESEAGIKVKKNVILEMNRFTKKKPVEKVILVCFSSNSSLCGGFNANAIRKTNERIDEYLKQGFQKEQITIFPVGKKIADAMKRLGYRCNLRFSDFSGNPNYEMAAHLADELVDLFLSGKCDRIELIYNHFNSTASQTVVEEPYLPISLEEMTVKSVAKNTEDYILEPNREELISILLPKVLKMKIFTVMLDTTAAEHAARTVAMQIATDNGNEILDDLTLQYNKSRQQRITSELLDILGGSVDQ